MKKLSKKLTPSTDTVYAYTCIQRLCGCTENFNYSSSSLYYYTIDYLKHA